MRKKEGNRHKKQTVRDRQTKRRRQTDKETETACRLRKKDGNQMDTGNKRKI